MIKFIKNILSKSAISRGAFILGIASLLSRLLGLVRDRLFASTFGAGDMLDAYYAAFRIPDFVFNLLILGALSSAFVPVFIKYLSKDKKDEAWEIANSLLNILFLATVVVCGLLFVFMDYLVVLVAPGFDQEKKDLTIMLTRIMLISPILFGISNIFSCILNSFKSFFTYSLAPILYNLGIIFGVIFLVPKYEVLGLAYGVAIGALLHGLIQLPQVFKLGYRWKPSFNISHKGVREIGKLMIPRSIALAFNQINLWVVTIIASTIASGSVAIYNLANNLQSFPIGIFGVSFSIAAFPCLAEAVARKDAKLFQEQFSKTFLKILFFVLPVSILMLLERAQIVRLILGAGHFDWNDTYLTAQALGLFSLSIFAQALIPLLARTFYSLSDTKTPVITSIISMIVNIIASLVLVNYMGVLGLALSFSIASFLNVILLIIALKVKVGGLDEKEIFREGIKITVATICMVIASYGMLQVLANQVDMQTYLGVFLQALGAALVGLVVYLIVGLILKQENAKDFIGNFYKIFKNDCK
ncbi:MAG: murein biosynthesis integral membrane protein MurJ [Parcubacteria group bacterium]|nr:murein biosynthesis integral membrane protein MurJ [Parcubacteria group bacterium]